MATTLAIKTQFYNLLRETSGDSHVTDTIATSYVNQTIREIARLTENPRKMSSGTQVTEGMGNITLPTDNILILKAYYGDISDINGAPELIVTKEEVIAKLFPNWLSENSDAEGEPTHFFQRNNTTGCLIPRANADSSATGKKVYFNYVYFPSDVSSDTDVPETAIAYHDNFKYFMAHLYYAGINPEISEYMHKKFMQFHETTKQNVLTETKESINFQWAVEY